MITEATISVVCVFIILMTACGFYALPSGEKKGRVFFMVLLFFSLMHIVGDGALRATVGTTRAWSWSDMEGGAFIYVVLFIAGLMGAIQSVFDMVWIKTHEKTSIGVLVIQQVPLLLLTIIIIAIRKPELSLIIRYLPLVYALICFLLSIWYFEKLNAGIRCGLIVATIGSVLVFLCNSLLHITDIPLLLPLVLIVIAVSFDGRGRLLSDESDEEEIIITTAKAGSAADERASEKTTGKDVSSEPEVELSELEQMMMDQKKRSDGGKLELGDEKEVPVADDTVSAVKEQPAVAAMREVQPAPAVSTQTASLDTIPIMEFLEAATVLTAESDSEAENAMQRLSQVDETVTDVLHARPLILEKDLNEFYHRMKKAVSNKDHDTCLEIMSEMSEYRFSGIHVTRYERIRHAVMDADWKSVERELKGF